jgi:hypothetical protein
VNFALTLMVSHAFHAMDLGLTIIHKKAARYLSRKRSKDSRLTRMRPAWASGGARTAFPENHKWLGNQSA